MEFSPLIEKQYWNVCMLLSFISVQAYDINKLKALTQLTFKKQKETGLKALSMVCNPSFTETLSKAANVESILCKIRSQFELLSSQMSCNEQCLSLVFLALATHNSKMGEWTIDRLLDISRDVPHARLLSDIVLCDPIRVP